MHVQWIGYGTRAFQLFDLFSTYFDLIFLAGDKNVLQLKNK